jgi:GNAT superfamily N-acetyltransferase
MPTALSIRRATSNDAQSIARLSEQLGYASSVNDTQRRLAVLQRDQRHAVFVAEADGQVVGWIHLFVSDSLVTDTHVEVAGLVIDEAHRGSGFGRALMQRAEQWAVEQGCSAVRLRSNVVRAQAHAFYHGLGYEIIKTQHAFGKSLP